MSERGIRQITGAIVYDSNLYFWLKPEPNINFELTFPGGYQYNIYLAKPMVNEEALRTIKVEIECAIKPVKEKNENATKTQTRRGEQQQNEHVKSAPNLLPMLT